MAKLATDILAIKDMINSFKNSDLKVEDIFKMIHKNEGFFLDKNNFLGMEDFFSEEDIDELEFSFEDSKNKKGKRYLN